MAKIPEFMLKSLYVKGSLKSEGDGFEFQVNNRLGPARIIGARPLQLNRVPIPIEKCPFVHGQERASFADVDADNSVLMRKGEAVTVRVLDTPLRPGRQTLSISFVVKDLGSVNFSISDRLR